MKIVISGSRHWKNRELIKRKLIELKEQYGASLEIAHGKSPGGGVDLMVEELCDELHIRQWPFPIRAGKTGIDGPNFKAAPLRRNERMIRTFIPDAVLAFRSGGKSNGTDHTLKMAHKYAVPHIETIREEDA